MTALAADITAATQPKDQPAPVTLAHACRGVVSGLLDQYAIPAAPPSPSRFVRWICRAAASAASPATWPDSLHS
ncbi:hypothetical protein ACIBHY_06325 [Nonomuraea sp. NPDC050547]|uniref:hypothetical protein n=1 Tax=unclassified Nonomuraea TaxID=2593643 RepID=UPI00378CF62E